MDQEVTNNEQEVTNNEQRAPQRLAPQQFCFANQFNAFYMIKKQIYSDLIEKKPSVRNLFFLFFLFYLTFSLLLFHKIAMM